MHGQRGQSLVEMLVVIGLSAIMLPALSLALVSSREGRAQEAERLRGTTLLAETDEAVRTVRQKGWSQFAVNGTYHPVVDGGTWSLVSGAEVTEGFTRQIVISDVQRNAGGTIVASGGTVDPSTKRVVTTVSWQKPLPSTISNEAYYQRYLSNNARTHTTQAELASGAEVNTVATATGGGQVELTSGTGSVNWGSPSVVGGYNTAGTQDSLDVAVVGNYAYFCDGAVFTILNITNPTTPTFVGTFTASATVRHIYVEGNYAYLSTINNNAELTIVDISDPALPVQASIVNLVDTSDALSTFVVGGFAYVGRAVDTTTGTNEMYIINVSNPASPSVLGSINLTGSVNNIKVSGNYAFLATTIDAQELVVVNVTNKNAPTISTSYNAPGTADINDLGILGTVLFLASVNNTSGAEVYAMNIATPTAPTLLGTYEVGGTVSGISPITGYLFLSTAITSRQLIILNSANASNLLLTANLNLGATANDVKANSTHAYVATASDTQEAMVVAPATTPGGYQTLGTLESTTFDQTASAAYNYITFSITEPDVNTQARFQIATNNDNTTWNYVGPDGTGASFYDSPVEILRGTTGRYLRYKVTMTSTGAATPLVHDISINYSP